MAAVYTTSYTFSIGTTSTTALMVWQLLSDEVVTRQRPLTVSEMSAQLGISEKRLEEICTQEYYQKHYGFRRFESEEAWAAWAKESGLLYDPERHGPMVEDDEDEFDDEDDDDDEDEEDEDDD